ncbi:BTAD domain-containing putative transcriptional regulator [Streptomyces sp. Edi2]|uniref:AfsR/SARP family transcriptional regulator n=1 Tax=Streptomyces sp. Edi2 TaxID=3162528 RepID=UPI0033065F57
MVIPSSKPTVLLGALLLHANETVSQEYLRNALWGDERPTAAGAAIHTTMLRLRKLLYKYGLAESGGNIETVPGGYRISADAGTLDLLAFREAVQRAGQAESEASELALLRRALSNWRGAPVANLVSPALHDGAAAALAEERINALARCHEIELALGNCAVITPQLRALSAEYKGNEQLTAQLMEALYRTGRQSEALAAYDSISRFLRETFGVDPGPALQQLHLAILRGETFAAATPTSRRRTVLAARPPTDLKDFTGRRTELAELQELLVRTGTPTIVVVSGLPGVGKSALTVRLARQLCEEHPDTGWFPGGWHFFDARQGDLQDEPAPLEHALIVLDGVRSSDEVLPALDWAEGHTIVITSRHSLADLVVSRGAAVFRVKPWRREESLTFLASVLGARLTTAEPKAADELAALCGDHPLALRILTTRLLLRPGHDLASAVRAARAASPASLMVGGRQGASVGQRFDDYLGTLPPSCGELLRELAAAREKSLSLTACAAMLGRAERELQDRLDELLEAGAVDYRPGGLYCIPTLLRSHLISGN